MATTKSLNLLSGVPVHRSLFIVQLFVNFVTIPDPIIYVPCCGDNMSLLEYWGVRLPPAKRRKTGTIATDTADTRSTSSKRKTEQRYRSEEEPLSISSPNISSEEYETKVPWEETTESRTDLESSLPEIKANDQSIDDYYYHYAVDVGEQPDKRSADQPLLSGEWKRGKSSIYVDAFNLALDTVLAEQAHLFDEAEMEVFRQWRSLSYEAQYL